LVSDVYISCRRKLSAALTADEKAFPNSTSGKTKSFNSVSLSEWQRDTQSAVRDMATYHVDAAPDDEEEAEFDGGNSLRQHSGNNDDNENENEHEHEHDTMGSGAHRGDDRNAEAIQEDHLAHDTNVTGTTEPTVQQNQNLGST
jgi:hypothetical protein